jgi:hypothetical protein
MGGLFVHWAENSGLNKVESKHVSIGLLSFGDIGKEKGIKKQPAMLTVTFTTLNKICVDYKFDVICSLTTAVVITMSVGFQVGYLVLGYSRSIQKS